MVEFGAFWRFRNRTILLVLIFYKISKIKYTSAIRSTIKRFIQPSDWLWYKQLVTLPTEFTAVTWPTNHTLTRRINASSLPRTLIRAAFITEIKENVNSSRKIEIDIIITDTVSEHAIKQLSWKPMTFMLLLLLLLLFYWFYSPCCSVSWALSDVSLVTATS